MVSNFFVILYNTNYLFLNRKGLSTVYKTEYSGLFTNFSTRETIKGCCWFVGFIWGQVSSTYFLWFHLSWILFLLLFFLVILGIILPYFPVNSLIKYVLLFLVNFFCFISFSLIMPFAGRSYVGGCISSPITTCFWYGKHHNLSSVQLMPLLIDFV